MCGKNFIQNCRRVNAEKIQISVGDKVIITISNAGNVGPIRKSSISNGVNIGTTEPSQKLDVGSGNVSANDYWIAPQANGRARRYNVYKNQHLELLVKRERYPATQAILLPVWL